MTVESEIEVVRSEPLFRIPDKLLESVRSLLEAYADRRNPPPTADDIAARLGEPPDIIRRACRKLEVRGLLVVNAADIASESTYSLPVEEVSGPIPEDLLFDVLGLIRSYEERSNPAPTVKDIAAGLGVEERDARWACTTLEADGLVRTVPTAQDRYPGYESIGVDPTTVSGALEDDLKEIVSAVVRSASRVLKADYGVEFRPSVSEVRQDGRTTEDWSFFLRVTGEIEGSIYFGIDQPALRGLTSALNRGSPDSSEPDLLALGASLVTRIGAEIGREIPGIGYDVEMSPSSSAQPAGMRVTSHGWPQVAVNLVGDSGPITAHVALYEPPEETEEEDDAAGRA